MQGAQTPPGAQVTGSELISTQFTGRRWPIFKLAFVTGILTVLSLGIYRFWQKTRVRRWYWSAIRPGGHPLEYVGDPFEKLLGFLIAVVILAFYIGVVNLALMFVSFSLFQGNVAAYALSLIGVVPIWFYARYRARRYVLARTRWMGLRFGLEPGAWGFAMRALWHWLLTIVTLGLLWPRMTFKLEKYRTDRTWFGDHRMEQGGKWTMLFWAIKWHLAGLGLALVCLPILGAGLAPLAVFGFCLSGLLILFGAVYYRVETRKRLTGTKRLGSIRLHLTISPLRVFWITLSGHFLALLISAVPTGFLLVLFLRLQSAHTLTEIGMQDLSLVFAGADRWLLVAMTVMSYFSVFLVWSAATQAWVTLPLTRLYARGLRIEGAQALPAINQRPRDHHLEAEGFADALDVGASL